MTIVSIILQVVLALAFLGAGGSKVAGVKQMKENFQHFGLPRWFLTVTGLIEVISAIGLIAGIWEPLLIVLAGLLLACTMIGAILAHIFLGHDSIGKSAAPFVLLVLSVLVIVLNWTAINNIHFA